MNENLKKLFDILLSNNPSILIRENEDYKIFKKIDSNFNDESKVVFEMFKVIEKYN